MALLPPMLDPVQEQGNPGKRPQQQAEERLPAAQSQGAPRKQLAAEQRRPGQRHHRRKRRFGAGREVDLLLHLIKLRLAL